MKKIIGILSFLCLTLVSAAQTPTVAATNVIFGNKYCSEVQVQWTNGNGAARIVIASEGAAVTSSPADNSFYLSSSTFSAGHLFSATEFVVYNGTGNSVTVTNLKKNTTYYFSVFEYNGGGTVFSYLRPGYPEASVTTENLTANFTVDDPYQCLRDNSVTFTPSVVRTGTGALSYSWRFGDGNTSNTQLPTHSYATKGLYDVQLTVSANQCEDVVVRKDTIAPDPDVSFILDPSIAGNSAEQCFLKPDGSLNTFEFLNTSFYDFLPTGFSNSIPTFYYGDGNQSLPNSNAPDHSYAQPGVYSVKLIVSSTFNNDVEFCTDSFEYTVTVRPRPIDTLLVELDSVMCLNNNSFDFDHNTLDASVVSTWTFGDGNSSIGNSATHSYNAIGKYYVKLEATDGIGCYDVYNDSIQVVPQPNNIIGMLDANYCEGDASVPLQAEIGGGDWLGDAVDASGVFTPNTLGTNEVRYAIEVDGCADTALLTTTVFERPFFELGNDTTLCRGTSFEKSITALGAAPLWSTGSTDTFTNVSSSGILWAQLTQGVCEYRDTINIGVIDAPSFNLGSDSTLCGGSFRNIDVSAPEATYSWSDGFLGPVRALTTSGTYQVTATNKCGEFSDEVELDFLPFACDIFVPNAFSPNGDGLNDIFRPTGNVVIKSMKIFNRWGEQVYEGRINNFGWNGIYKGQLAKSDHYFFMIRYEKPVPGGVEPLEANGHVFLMR